MKPNIASEPPAFAGQSQLDAELHWLENLTEEDFAAARRELRAASRPMRPLPEGKTLSDMVCGSWPGDETDEEIDEALERLS